MNPQDPMLKAGPDSERQLFDAFARDANGFSIDDAINAAANILVNAIRQQCQTRKDAETKFDELFAKTKTLLLDKHYDSTGRLRGIFPYDQSVVVPLIRIKERFPSTA